MLAIRLSRTGSSKRPHFRVVVSDSKRARDSRFVEVLGHYNPRAVPAVVEVNRERVDYWLKVGARPSDTVRTLLRRHVTTPTAAMAEPAVPTPPAVAAAPVEDTPSPAAAGEAGGQ